MRIFLALIGCLSLTLTACGLHEESNGQSTTSDPANSSSPSAGAECMADFPFPANPEQAAMNATSRGDSRLFRYYKTVGTGVQNVVAGFEQCDGPGLAVRGQRPSEDVGQADTIDLGDIRDRSHPLDDCDDCDFPLSICGQRRLAYAARYNRKIFDLGARRPRPQCPSSPPAAGPS